MSDIDPNSDVTEVRTTYDPVTASTTQVRREYRSRGPGLGWLLGGLVALAAIGAAFYLLGERKAPVAPDPSIAAATSLGAAQASADDARDAALATQANAAATMQSNQAAMQQSTDIAAQSAAARAAADRSAAEAAANRAAVSAARAASTPPPDPSSDQPPPQN